MSVIKKFRITKIKNSKPFVSLKNLYLLIKNHLILDNINLDIAKGQVVGLLGPNGAEIISNKYYNRSDKTNFGKIFINNQDISSHPIYTRMKNSKFL